MKTTIIPKALLHAFKISDSTERETKLKAMAELGAKPFNITISNAQPTNADADEAIIDIDGEIGFDWWAMTMEEAQRNTSDSISKVLKDISASKITVNISSPGGDVPDGLVIHDLLREHAATVTTHVRGMTASIATVIAQAGDYRRISKNALYLVHQSWSIAMCNVNDMMDMAGTLATIDGKIAQLYADRSGKDVETFKELMAKSNGDGIWITAEQALEYGLVDEIVEPGKKEPAQNLKVTEPITNTVENQHSAEDEKRAMRLRILELEHEPNN